MIDIHHHILPATDDGPKDLESAIEQAEVAIADGITHVVCTPHANFQFDFDPARNRERLETIRERVGSRLTLGLGCDFHLSSENIDDALKNPAKYTINGGGYLLVEFSDFSLIPDAGATFHEFRLKGISPIITHPERNRMLQRDPSRLADFIMWGCLVQITASSLSGRWGKQAEAISWDLLEKNWTHFVATDAHDLMSRRPALRTAYQAIAKRLGQATAERMCVENPLAAFENRKLEVQPEPKGIDFDLDEPAKKRRLLAKLFGK